MATAKQVEIAHRLYSARDTLRRLFGTDYQQKIGQFMRMVDERAEGIGYLRAGMLCVEALLKANESMGAMWLMAATVELIEPDELTPKVEVTNAK